MAPDQYRISLFNSHWHPVGVGRNHFGGLIKNGAIPKIHTLGDFFPKNIDGGRIGAVNFSALDVSGNGRVGDESEIRGPVCSHADPEVFPTSAYIALHLIRVVEQSRPPIRITHAAGEGHHVELTKSPSGYITNAYDLDGMLLTQNLPQG